MILASSKNKEIPGSVAFQKRLCIENFFFKQKSDVSETEKYFEIG